MAYEKIIFISHLFFITQLIGNPKFRIFAQSIEIT